MTVKPEISFYQIDGNKNIFEWDKDNFKNQMIVQIDRQELNTPEIRDLSRSRMKSNGNVSLQKL